MNFFNSSLIIFLGLYSTTYANWEEEREKLLIRQKELEEITANMMGESKRWLNELVQKIETHRNYQAYSDTLKNPSCAKNLMKSVMAEAVETFSDYPLMGTYIINNVYVDFFNFLTYWTPEKSESRFEFKFVKYCPDICCLYKNGYQSNCRFGEDPYSIENSLKVHLIEQRTLQHNKAFNDFKNAQLIEEMAHFFKSTSDSNKLPVRSQSANF